MMTDAILAIFSFLSSIPFTDAILPEGHPGFTVALKANWVRYMRPMILAIESKSSITDIAISNFSMDVFILYKIFRLEVLYRVIDMKAETGPVTVLVFLPVIIDTATAMMAPRTENPIWIQRRTVVTFAKVILFWSRPSTHVRFPLGSGFTVALNANRVR
jgi:hypothetical protein